MRRFYLTSILSVATFWNSKMTETNDEFFELFFVHFIVLTASVEHNYEPSTVSEVIVVRPHLHDITTNGFVFGEFKTFENLNFGENF